ncbi:hypothetical protein CsSME_00050288 [Camellia sinensis var. sinensis]
MDWTFRDQLFGCQWSLLATNYNFGHRKLSDEALVTNSRPTHFGRKKILATKYGTFRDQNDIFIAGTETTSSTMEWAMAEILHNPKTLFEARVEFEKTIGKGKQVKESDIPQLPYLRAIVKETFRKHRTVPLLVPRKVEVDVEVCGFNVPKGTQVLVNAWGIGRDRSTCESPNLFGQDFELIPFGAGKRICPGLPLAMRMLHLMLGSLIYSFDWKLVDGISPKEMNMEEKFGFTLKKAQPLRVAPVYL